MDRTFALLLVFFISWFAQAAPHFPKVYVKKGDRFVEIKPIPMGPLKGKPRVGYSFHFGDVAPGSHFTGQFHLGGPETQTFGAFAHSGSSDFSIVSNACTGISVPPYGHCAIDIKFMPSSEGTMSAEFVTHVDATNGIDFYDFDFTFSFQGSSQPVPPEQEKLACGSVIGVDSQTLGESIPVVGTDLSLVYSSRFAPEYVTSSNVFNPIRSFNREGWTLSKHHQYDSIQRRLFLGTGQIEYREAFAEGFGTSVVVSADGSELYWFLNGLHMYTYNSLTNSLKYTFSYDVNQDLEFITDAYGNQTTITRDVNGRMTSIVGPYGQVTTITTGVNGLIDTVTNPNSETYTLTYKTGTGLLQAFEKPEGQVNTFTYDVNGKLTKDLGNGGNFWELISGVGSITQESQMGRQTTIATGYSVSGNYNRTETTPYGQVRTYSDNRGQSFSESDSVQMVDIGKTPDERFGNGFKRVNQRMEVINSVYFTTYYGKSVDYPTGITPDYTNFSKITETVNKGGNVTTTEYDPSTLTSVTTTQEGATFTSVIDSNERPVSLQVGSDTATTFTYDLNGRLSGSIQGSNNQKIYAYNLNGYLQSITNALSQVTSYGYDLAGRMTSVTLPDTRVIQYSYDGNGNLTGVTPPGKPLHAFTLNAFELTDEYQPPTLLGVSVVNTQYSYNMDKQLTQITRPTGATAVYNYGSTTGLLNSVTLAAGTNSYSYHTNTDLVSRIDSADGIRSDYTYYGYNLASEEQLKSSGSTRVGKLIRNFDSQHRLSSLQFHGQSTTPSYTLSRTYNGDDQPTQIDFMSLTYEYPSGRLSTRTLDRISDSRTYDTYGNLASYSSIYTPVSGPVVNLYSYTLTRDTLHRITSKVETIQGVTTTFTYTYDSSGRLDTVLRNGLAYSNYVYDSNGNRTSGATAGSAFTSTFDNQDRILTYGATRSYGYNANGDRTSVTISGVGTQTYDWDALGNLKGVVTTTSMPLDFDYDGTNRNVVYSENGTVQFRALWENDLRMTAKINNSGTVFEIYVHGTMVNTPDVVRKSGNRHMVITDHLGSPRLVVRSTDGVVMQRLDYTDLGMITYDSSPGFQPYGYAGGIWYPQVAAFKFGARFYEPRAGRWLSKDPIGFEGGDTNLYGYVENDSINWIDPEGLSRIGDRMLQGRQQDMGGGPRGPVPSAGRGGRFDPNQQAVVDLAKQIERRGSINKCEAEQLVKWGKEYNVPNTRIDPGHPRRKTNFPHVHVGPVDHLPIK